MNYTTDLSSLAINGQSTGYQELFPYLYISDAPKVTQADIDNAFFQIPKAVMTPAYSESLIAKLIVAKQQGKRQDMLTLAANYINSGDFLRTQYQIGEPLVSIMHTRTEDFTDTITIKEIMVNAFGSPEKFKLFISPPKADYENLWLSIICMLIELDYERQWLESLLSLAKKMNLLQLALPYVETNGEIPEPLISLWLGASLLLDKEIFPLPPGGDAKAEPNLSIYEHARPYAIGTLHLVKYKLVGYQLGELKNVESILQGETKHNKTRYRNREHDSNHDNSTEKRSKKKQEHNLDQDFTTQVQKTIADRKVTTNADDYSTSYSATNPNITTKGGWTVDESPAGGNSENNAKFIKDILTETRDRVESEIFAARQKTLEQEYEYSHSHTLANTTDRNINGFYYWLNKTYKVEAKDSEKRMLIEVNFELDDDELHQILAEHDRLNLTPPKTLAELGINSYSDIVAEKAEAKEPNQQTDAQSQQQSEYYLDLCQQFSVKDILAPPSAKHFLAKTIRSEQGVCNGTLPLPEGYIITSGNVTLSVEGDISGATVTFAGKTIAMNKPAKLNKTQETLKGDTITVLVGTFTPDVFDEAITGSLPVSSMVTVAKTAPDLTNDTIVFNQTLDVKLDLKRTEQALSHWQFDMYNRLTLGYESQLKAYRASLDELSAWLQAHDTPKTQALINNYLIKKTMHRLYLNAMAHLGKTTASPMAELPYNQYFKRALDWPNLYCKLFEFPQPETVDKTQPISSTKGALAQLDSELYLRRFLTANSAKVMVPVHCDQVISFVYFLDSGQIWHGEEQFSPVNPIALPIINDFKKLTHSSNHEYIDVDSWKVTLPTTMSVLNDRENLNHIGEHLDD